MAIDKLYVNIRTEKKLIWHDSETDRAYAIIEVQVEKHTPELRLFEVEI